MLFFLTRPFWIDNPHCTSFTNYCKKMVQDLCKLFCFFQNACVFSKLFHSSSDMLLAREQKLDLIVRFFTRISWMLHGQNLHMSGGIQILQRDL